MALSDPKTPLLLITALLTTGGILGLLRQVDKSLKTRLALTCALGASLLTAYSAIGFWQDPMHAGETLLPLFELPSELSFPPLGLDLYVDRLSAFFLLLTGLLSAAVALYSFVWLADKKEQHRMAGVYNFFVLFTLLLLVVNNVYLFLICLECMTLAFSYLTLYKHNTLLEKKPGFFFKNQASPHKEMQEAKLAFKAYLVFSHVGAMFIIAAFILLALLSNDLGFDALRTPDPTTNPALSSTVFVLALIGFGIKGGFAPAHPWVSIVHPKSPTTTHALTLGLVIKISSFYGLMRFCFEFLPPGPWWWGWLVLLLAGLTALVGVFYAITSRDLKTALSNHSVENFGIILAGMGLALLLSSEHSSPALSGLALVAGLYHLLNHTIFKSLLYLCTGAIENRTGTVHLEELGGLMRRFRWTSITFLVGAVAIAGFPPFNGFASEWLTLQVIFASQDLFARVHPWMVVGIFGTLLMLGLAFGLTALAFVKIAGETLLGAPRRPDVLIQEKQGDVPWPMRGVLVILAALCLLLGLFPGWVVNQLARIPQELLAPPGSLQGVETTATSLALNVDGYSAQISMLPLLTLAALPLALAALVVGMRRGRPKRGPLWTCGTDYVPGAMQITGGAFAFLTWEWAGEKATTPTKAEHVPWRLRLSENRYAREGFRRVLNASVNRLLRVSEQFGNWFQGGDVRQYLGYLFIVFILALIASVI
jgi:hydrogenase-4 component B